MMKRKALCHLFLNVCLNLCQLRTKSMKISYNWLKQYVQTDLSPEEIAKILTETGLEVDGIEKIEAVKGGLQGVVVGEVLQCEKHPDADKLKLTQVNLGSETVQIVCGAPNVAAGQKVLVATVGTTLYPKPDEAFKIKLSKIRGAESFGMICAEDELGLGQSHDGILVLPADTKVGLGAATYFELEDDYQIEIGLTPNRADALGHLGVARDLLAYLKFHEDSKQEIKWPELKSIAQGTANLPVHISVEEPELCPTYLGLSMADVKIQASPSWLQKRLRAVGLSPINNVVDCTNFVMRELGTPLHAFDYEAVKHGIVVKKAKTGEKFTTLDGTERVLDAENLMITSNKVNLALAGVMGGLQSGITPQTQAIFIESAYFNPVSVRKTAKFHGLNTDASFRYERGVDPNLTHFALKRVANLIQEVAGGTYAMEVVRAQGEAILPFIVDFRPVYANKIIGIEMTEADMKKILSALEIKVLDQAAGMWKLEVPAYRVDVYREIDIVEEILRIYSFNKVPVPTKLNSSIQFVKGPAKEKLLAITSELLVSNGFVEIMNNSLTALAYTDKLLDKADLAQEQVAVLNPLSQDLSVLRQSLVFGALESLAHNQNRQNADLKFFEFGKVYGCTEDKYHENSRLFLTLSGNKQTEQWNATKGKVSYFSLKGIVYSLMERLGFLSLLKETNLDSPILSDGVSLNVLNTAIGSMGWLSPKMRKHFGVKNEVFVADLDWDAIVSCLKMTKVQFKEVPKTFEVRRDYSLLLDEAVKYAEIEQIARKVDKKILKGTQLFDVYEGDKLEAGKKSYAVAFFFQDAQQTLKDAEVDQLMQKIRSELENKLGAQLR